MWNRVMVVIGALGLWSSALAKKPKAGKSAPGNCNVSKQIPVESMKAIQYVIEANGNAMLYFTTAADKVTVTSASPSAGNCKGAGTGTVCLQKHDNLPPPSDATLTLSHKTFKDGDVLSFSGAIAHFDDNSSGGWQDAPHSDLKHYERPGLWAFVFTYGGEDYIMLYQKGEKLSWLTASTSACPKLPVPLKTTPEALAYYSPGNFDQYTKKLMKKIVDPHQ